MKDILDIQYGVRLAIGAVLVAALSFGCGYVPPPTDPAPIPNISFNCIGNSCNTGEQGNGNGTGSNGTPSLPDGSTVRVGIFGHDCPAGVTAPNNGSGQIKIACRGAGITATPKDKSGADLDATVHGSTVEWQVTGGGATCTGSYLGNVFNQFCTCPAGSAGTTFSLTAKVKNVTGVLNGTCIS